MSEIKFKQLRYEINNIVWLFESLCLGLVSMLPNLDNFNYKTRTVWTAYKNKNVISVGYPI